MKYRKKPVVIEAIQYIGTNNPFNCIQHKAFNEGMQPAARYTAPVVKTLNGWICIDIADWIIKGVKGEFYVCPPFIFEETYEKVEE
jgi:hypothetical protein